MGLPVAHVEAGLRSYDLRMPEEHDRRLTDHLSTLLFALTKQAAPILNGESCWGSIHITGNTVIDSCLYYGPSAQKSRIFENIPFQQFALVTAHRAENLVEPAFLAGLVNLLLRCPLPVVYPMHPRTLEKA